MVLDIFDNLYMKQNRMEFRIDFSLKRVGACSSINHVGDGHDPNAYVYD